jgi:4-hydroxy-tetrahydrodipicolinate reductase
MKKLQYGIIGASGAMGREIENVFSEAGHECVFKFDLSGEWKVNKPELLIDFSLPEVLDTTIRYAEEFNVPLISGTTGLTDEQIAGLKN